MRILSIETSCDETGAAIVFKNPHKNYVKILSNVVASSLIYHSKTGGIIPNVAAREQLKFIIPVIEKAIGDSKITVKDIDAIAVTIGPGLIGSLVIGVETAKTLAYAWNKPIIPVNHLLGHIYANFVNSQLQTYNPQLITFPAIALIVSGGHTDLVLLINHQKIKWIGGTLDDAAGEAFDKIGRLLGLPYPAGPIIEKLAQKGDPSIFPFPSPMIYSKDFDFSFSGLKTAVWRETKIIKNFDDKKIANLCASTQKAITDVLAKKTLNAAQNYKVKSILLGGGVASNQSLRDELSVKCSMLNVKLFAPQKSLCTDNAAMIGAYAVFNYKKVPWDKITANPELYF